MTNAYDNFMNTIPQHLQAKLGKKLTPDERVELIKDLDLYGVKISEYTRDQAILTNKEFFEKYPDENIKIITLAYDFRIIADSLLGNDYRITTKFYGRNERNKK